MSAALLALLLVAPPAPQPPAAPESPEAMAKRIALAALDRASALDKLPRFSYATTYRNGVVDSLRGVEGTLDQLKAGLTGPILDKDVIGPLAQKFSWDESHFIEEFRAALPKWESFNTIAWTRADAWHRNGQSEASPARFTRQAGPASLWRNNVHMFHYGYLRVAPHSYWWGGARPNSTSQTMSLYPPAETTWRHLGSETLDGEECDIVHGAERYQRLWVGRKSGNILAVLTLQPEWTDECSALLAKLPPFRQSEAVRAIAGREFASQREYEDWIDAAGAGQEARITVAFCAHIAGLPERPTKPSEYMRFSEFREVAPGVWLPLREARTQTRYGDKPGVKNIERYELRVDQMRADVDLAGRYAQLLPKPGEKVQDQRFGAAIDYEFDPARTDTAIRAEADAKSRKQQENGEYLKKMLEPLDKLVGQPAPALPADGWVNGKPPSAAGGPYLVQFWAVWCGPCKGDLPRLKQLAESGVTVVGMHPPGTPPKEVGEAAGELKMTWPTFAAPGDGNTGGKASDLAGYKVGAFPWYVLVGGDGKVLAHGRLDELVRKHGVGAMRPGR